MLNSLSVALRAGGPRHPAALDSVYGSLHTLVRPSSGFRLSPQIGSLYFTSTTGVRRSYHKQRRVEPSGFTLPPPEKTPAATDSTTMTRTPGISRPASPLPNPLPPRKILVLGAGNFGSCLADHLGDSEHEVLLWSRDENLVGHFNTHHRNPTCLHEHVFPKSIVAVGPELPDAETIAGVDVLLFAIPTEGVRETLTKLRPRLNLEKLPLLIFVNKGIEISTRALTLEIIADTCGAEIAKVATFLSGPSFAKEIIRRQPTSVSIVSLSPEHAKKASDVFHQPWFRCYSGADPIGVELAGALKNVYAIAAGIADGLGFENNTRAMLITRGLSEMTRIGTAYGASPLTFLGLAGVGDLFLTCTSSASRNYTVGYRLGQGEKLDDIIRTLGSVAEGVTTAKALMRIIENLGTDVAPSIAVAMYKVLYEGKDANEAAKELLKLPPLKELDLPAQASNGPAQVLLRKLGVAE